MSLSLKQISERYFCSVSNNVYRNIYPAILFTVELKHYNVLWKPLGHSTGLSGFRQQLLGTALAVLCSLNCEGKWFSLLRLTKPLARV